VRTQAIPTASPLTGRPGLAPGWDDAAGPQAPPPETGLSRRRWSIALAPSASGTAPPTMAQRELADKGARIARRAREEIGVPTAPC
jgi:hypothetical protein